jgi:hypothetical protein
MTNTTEYAQNMTKREHLAAMLMSALITTQNADPFDHEVNAMNAIDAADKLIEVLNREPFIKEATA